MFISSAFAAVAMAIIWILKCPKINLHIQSETGEAKQSSFPWSIMLIGILLAITMQGYLRDGVSTWMPSLISETFNLSSKISILSGVAFPIFSILVFNFVARIYRRYVRNELNLAGIVFFSGTISALGLALLSGLNAILTVVLVSLLIGSMHGVNLMLICMVPRHYSKFGRVSMVSGLFNSFTYLGSAASAYSIAAFAENFGWSNTSLFWAVIAFLGGVLCIGLRKGWANFTRDDL